MKFNENAKNPLALIVDDDFSVRLLAGEALEQAGFRVREAQNGKDALQIFREHRPDIVLLDVKMPVMNGFDTCRELRRIPDAENLPILMITGADDIRSIEDAYKAGATDFMPKPINWLVMIQRVRYMLRAKENLEKLRKSEAGLATAQRIAKLGSWELNTVNEAFRCSYETVRIFGLGEHAKIRDFTDIFGRVREDDREELQNKLQHAKYKGVAFKLDHRIVVSEKTERVVHHQIDPVMNTDGKVVQLIGTVQDITERNKAEYLEVARNRILEMIIRNEPLSEIFASLLEIIRQQRPESACVIFGFRDNTLIVETASGFSDAFIERIDEQIVGPSEGGITMSAYTGDTMIFSDIETNPVWAKYRSGLPELGFRACYSVPVMSGKGQILGTLAVFHPHVFQPADSDLYLLETLAKLAAVAIERHVLVERLEHQSKHDELTGLPNRAGISEGLQRAIVAALENKTKLGVFFVDLDRFQQVNDSLGHPIGDQILKKVASRLKNGIDENTLVGCFGGDQFICARSFTHPQELSEIADRLLAVISPTFEIDGRELYVGASIGVSVFPDDGKTPVSLQRNADTAMYYAKNAGGHRYHFYSAKMNAVAIERLEIENDLRKAVEQGHFELHYQPKYELVSKKLAGFEALLRWNHPELGRVPPIKFIRIAEESELIIPIGTWVINEACQQNVRWEKMGLGKFRVAVNVSVSQFMRENFVMLVDDALKKTGLPPNRLELEIIENIVINDLPLGVRRLAELNEIGVVTSIDDFGTGYSSMSYLHHLPVYGLKIDRSFVQRISGDAQDAERAKTMIGSMIKLGHDLNFKIVAEGPEDSEQVRFLTEGGCDFAQGYYFNMPMSVKEIETKCRHEMLNGLSASALK